MAVVNTADCSSLGTWEQDAWLDRFAPSLDYSPSDDPALSAAYHFQLHQHEMCKLLAKGQNTFEFVKSHKLRSKVAILPQPDVLIGPNAQPLIPVVVLDSVLAQELIAAKKLSKQAQIKLATDAKEIVFNKRNRRLTHDLRHLLTDDLPAIRRLLQHNARHCAPSDWQRLHLPPGAHTLDSSPWYASYLTPISLEELQAIINAPEQTAATPNPGPNLGPAASAGPSAPTARAAPPLLDGFRDEELQAVLPLLLPVTDILLNLAQAVSEQGEAFEGQETLESWRDAAEKLLIGRVVEPWPLFPVGTCSGPQYDKANQAFALFALAATQALQDIVEAAYATASAALGKQLAAGEAVRAACNTMSLQTAGLKQALAREAATDKAARKDHSPRMQKTAAAASEAVRAQTVKLEEAQAAVTVAESAQVTAENKAILRVQAAKQKSAGFANLMKAIKAGLLLPMPAAWAPLPVAASPALSDGDLPLPPPEPMWGSVMTMPPRHQ